jgi:hypothetical protein
MNGRERDGKIDSLSAGTVATHQHPIQAAMLAVIVIESGFMQ